MSCLSVRPSVASLYVWLLHFKREFHKTLHACLLHYGEMHIITAFWSPFFLARLDKGHVSFCHHLVSIVRRKLSHFNLLLRNYWANCNQTLVEWSFDGPLPKMCPVIPTSNQDGCQAKNRKKGGMQF